ncbi:MULTISPECIES: polyhydroxyalkanoate synthesis repressor PhaR [Halomonadaceae]|uniref:Polyhydroxyalkanoate synthesis repressor PhaR n=2 Tax=Vreelandella titanicae TaxID=664683 RepID=L9U8H8_9GAMM|nr:MULTISPECIES: polyhydroxyalkanoate synthesis repressor PhaR [Halomonas]NAO95157.1 polyhydroxyalkanoate synthesis repressor PhaR [Halomonas sp. MG34]QGQ72092.1 polyhydroxyalkanoate synthesis repressor PhaR [Halomonas sp. PA16-9]UEQ02572.1 polyhydroxyalkanoate synthesis repressor PhaR [Halomonas profundus]ELY21215.1 Polyhydroxyalkanoate synthesis repressor PhaR [Halomonas titanicae BH1]KIN15156.1 polyhydroxyalkanoate synthesis repressor PhaR [Halomonas sp. KHS3]
MRVIRKYANRRLYDTQQSRYVTLEDLRRLIIEEEPFRVEDAKSGEDLTRTILLSIIIEQEQADSEAEVFSNDLLAQLIRVYDMTSPLPLSRYLEQGTQLMLEQQKRLQSQWKQAMRNTPLEFMRELAEENMRFWQNTLNQPGQADESSDAEQPESDSNDTSKDNKPSS